MKTRHEQFVEIYTKKLVDAMRLDPAGWFDTPETAGLLAERMTDALRRGTANLSPQIRGTARALGIKDTVAAIREWLSHVETV